MSAKTPNERIIFGLKVKQLRQGQGKSFADLAAATGMSVSYLNEIEKGKKFPKADKVANLARALGTSEEELKSRGMGRHLEPVESLLRSNFLNELPLELFGIELGKVAEIIANAPVRVGAFISTLLELSRSYSLREENFYFGALRAYLELHDNYFQDLEDAANSFVARHSISANRPLPPRQLSQLLEEVFGYTIVENGLDHYPALGNLRSVFLPTSKKLLLNSNLNARQRAFQFGKELAFNALRLQERAQTSSLLRIRSFEEVLNHSKATYFSVALHLPLEAFIAELERFFQQEKWNAQAIVDILQQYNITPEMFYHRLTNVMPKFFGIPQLFFLRFTHNQSTGEFSIDRELHLNRRHHPHANAIQEHYCRRWISLSLLEDLQKRLATGENLQQIVDVQRSRYLGTEDEYLCITLARPGYPSPHHNVSVTLGLLINDDVKRTIKWLDDPNIQYREVHTTCERCMLQDCQERAAEPTIVRKREEFRRIQSALQSLE
ncbi:MAG: helix-turn-helix domain-containing protein [Bacteroidota bacterium]